MIYQLSIPLQAQRGAGDNAMSQKCVVLALLAGLLTSLPLTASPVDCQWDTSEST
jgi:hypothetical protein